MLYRRGNIWWCKLRGRRYSLETTDEAEAREKYTTARLDLELNDDAYFARALRVAEGHRRRVAARARGEADRRSVSGAIDRWLRAMTPEIRSTTLERYRFASARWKKRWGPLPLTRLTSAHLEEFRTDCLRRLARTSVRTELATLRAFLHWCERSRLLAEAPAVPSLRGVPRKRVRPAALEPDELERLLAASAGLPIEPLIYLGAFAGLRQSEAMALRWAEVDLRNGVLIVLPAKSPEAREVPLSPRLAAYLAKLPRDSENVVTGLRTKAAANHHARRLWEGCGLYQRGNPTLHALRHTFATRLVHTGADVETVRQLLGHSSVAISQIYFSTTLDRKRAAVAGL